jgi:selenocysteine lyase/cysteine desulfurase
MRRREAIAGAVSALSLLRGAAEAAQLPDSALFEKDPEAYWRRVREEQFLLPDWRVFLNNGSLGIIPRPVLEVMTNYLKSAAGLESDEYPRWGYETLDAQRAEFAGFCGARPEDLAFVHNATEAMSIIAAGIDLKAGDEVVISDQEHPSGKNPWFEKRARFGLEVREVKLPLPPASPEQLVDVMVSALGPKTRVLSFSGIVTTTGLVMPARPICDEARRKGVVTVIDGAHMIGQIPFRLDALGCDYFAGSPHKWLFAPAGTGILWGREEMLAKLWPSTVTGGWDDQKLKSARFMLVGTNNRAVIEGALAGLRFAKQMGPDRIYARIHQLARMVRAKAQERGLQLLTPGDDRLYGSLTTFQLPPERSKKLYELCRKRRIWISGAERLRVSTHIHTRPQDIDTFFATLDEC